MDKRYYAFARKCDDETYVIMYEGTEPKILVASKPGIIREAVKRTHLENNLFNMDDYHRAYKFRKN